MVGLRYYINLDMIVYIVIIFLVIYFFFFIDKRKRKYKFQGIGNSGFDVDSAKNEWKEIKTRVKKPRQKRINKHEERCREIFEDIFGKPFKSVKPQWLKNPVTGRKLELDGFCPGIKTHLGYGLAFEYDGIQHSQYNKYFHKNGPQEFMYQVKKDSWKDMRCKQENILLVRIPNFIAFHDLERYIKVKLQRHGLFPPNRFNQSPANTHFRRIYGTSSKLRYFNQSNNRVIS